MMKGGLLILFGLLGVLVTVEAQTNGTCPRPSAVGTCIQNCLPGLGSCPTCNICCQNACGGYTCTRSLESGVPPWCPPGSPRIFCLANPCDVTTCPRFPNARCINDNPCEPNCVANFYIGFFRIPRWLCNARG